MKRQVIVVGAGPSGSSTAFYLAKKGIDVLLLDKEPWPRDKVCGDGWLPSLYPLFEEMGIMEEMREANTCHADKIILASPNEDVASFGLAGAEMLVIPRRIGDDIVRRAAIREGAEMMENFDATELIIRRGVVKGVKGYYRNELMEIEADAVVIANGSHSMLAKQLGIFNEDPSLSMFACRGYFTDVPDIIPDNTIYQFYLPDSVPNYSGNTMSFGWISRLDEPGQGTLGLVVPIETIQGLGMSLEELFNWYLTKSINGPKYFKGAKLVDELKGWRLLGCKEAQKNYAAGALLVGDACSQAECAHFYGIPTGMISGKIAADVLEHALATGDFSEEALSIFHKLVGDKLNPEYEFYAKFRELVHFDIENVNKMNAYAKTLPDYPNLQYNVVMHKFLTEVMDQKMPTVSATSERLSQ